MSTLSNAVSRIISAPQDGRVLQGIPEKFSSDLFKGTGNSTIPIALLPGRIGFQSQISLVYSTIRNYLPDVFEMNGSVGYLPNICRGAFALPHSTEKAPPKQLNDFPDADFSDSWVKRLNSALHSSGQQICESSERKP